jgi:hypothetical protein
VGTVTKPALWDPDVYPGDDVLNGILGPARAAYDALFAFTRTRHPDLVATWKYYQDGGRWLLHLSRGRKTVFWLAVSLGAFRTTFYLSEAYDAAIRESDLPPTLKTEYAATAGRTFRSINVAVRTVDDVEPCKLLIAIKLAEAR